MENIIDIFKAYNGTGYYCILFIAALIYLWFSEEDKSIRAILVIAPTIIQILFFVPYFYMLYNMLDEGTYYRILWLLPMTLVIAYAGCKVIGDNTKMGLFIMSMILIISGSLVYTSVNMSRAENLYHLPAEAVTVCDMVMPEEGEERVWVAFPPDMVHYVRQYSTEIQMPYGRDPYQVLERPVMDRGLTAIVGYLGWLGFLIATFVFYFIWMAVIDRRVKVTHFIVAAVCAGLLYYVFHNVLGVLLPAGLLEGVLA